MCCNSPSHEDTRPWTETYPYNSGVGVLVPHVPAEGVVSLFGGDQGHKRSQDEAWFNRTCALMTETGTQPAQRPLEATVRRWRSTCLGGRPPEKVPPDALTVGFQAPGLRDSVDVNWLCLGCWLGPSPHKQTDAAHRGDCSCAHCRGQRVRHFPHLSACAEPLPQPGTGLAWGGAGGGWYPQGAAWGSSVRPHGAAQA